MKQIIGFENYSISEDGKVFNNKTGRELKAFDGNRGYKTIYLRKDGKNHGHLLHRLLAIHFITNPENKGFVNHKDGNKHNNDLSNLEWVTQAENNKHAFDIGLKSHVGEKHNQSILTEEQVLEIRWLYEIGVKPSEMFSAYGVSRETIWSIIQRKTWKHI